MSYRFGFIMEQTLGHVTHSENLAAHVAAEADIEAVWIPISPDDNDRWDKVPFVRNNWALKSSLRARAALRPYRDSGRLDAALFHTQSPALFAHSAVAHTPCVISLDATPCDFDRLHLNAMNLKAAGPDAGSGYNHSVQGVRLERMKLRWYRTTFERAAALIAWSEWTRDSLVRDYGVPSEKVCVVPPGVDLAAWGVAQARPTAPDRAVRLLFVGSDFRRKGGDLLRSALADLSRTSGFECETDIVSAQAELEPGSAASDRVASDRVASDRIRVHRSLSANSADIRALYASSDIFVLPTRADCLPLAIIEAMASGLPVISTRVGAIPEMVHHGVTGLLVPPGDRTALIEAIRLLAASPARRAAMGAAARALAEKRYSAAGNYGTVLAVLRRVAGSAAMQRRPQARR